MNNLKQMYKKLLTAQNDLNDIIQQLKDPEKWNEIQGIDIEYISLDIEYIIDDLNSAISLLEKYEEDEE